MTPLRSLLAAGLLLCAFAPAKVLAAPAATVAVDVVLASKQPGDTDPRLAKFRTQFADFAYKSFKLVGSRLITVEEKQSTQVDLAGDHKLSVTFTKFEANGRAKLKLAVPGVMDTTISLARDGSVVVGGPALKSGDGVLFVPVTLVEVK
ncbi:hypothetical protein [Vulgatibacter incomptus]|uniref:Uncharacterized protein n=1 Tax=Vulgatibacter incomptus TaxID=1391653 RepID=A0A0K1PI51_9BACT|nr:hypothetical protein [Vulgatibacter incomptus]AKU93091.1 hypothetical protein AKJ08_3478 [Vulgatibacter incomptus]